METSRLCVQDLLQRTQQHKTYCFSDRESAVSKSMNPCVAAWGVHTALWEGFELTQVTVAPSLVWGRKGWIIQPASFDVFLFYKGGEANSHHQAHIHNLRGNLNVPQDEGRRFREQQWNNSSLSKWQPLSRRTITDCWSITPHMEDEMTALPCW